MERWSLNRKAKIRYEYLVEELHYHNWLYNFLDAPEISDYDWDIMLIELRKLEEKYPELITEESPSQCAGTKNSEKYYLKRISS